MQRSLGLTLARAMGAGWENVTASTLSLDPHLVRLGEVTLPPVRAQLTPAFIFVRVWKDHLCPFIAQAINSDLPVPQRNIHREAALVSSEEMWCYVRVLVWMIAHPPTTWEAWRADPHLPEGLSLTRLRKIKAWLNFDDVKAAEMLCDELRKWVKVPGRVTLDETMIGWKGSHPAVVYIPRKPVPTGVKCFNISCQFSRQRQSFPSSLPPGRGFSLCDQVCKFGVGHEVSRAQCPSFLHGGLLVWHVAMAGGPHICSVHRCDSIEPGQGVVGAFYLEAAPGGVPCFQEGGPLALCLCRWEGCAHFFQLLQCCSFSGECSCG